MKFAKTHEWVRHEGDSATVGISEHAQKELGDIVFVELPSVGDTVSAGARCATIESTKAASEVYSPISGEVVEVNTLLGSQPELINKDAHDQGWIFKVKIKDAKELDALLDEAAYQEVIKKEAH